MNNIRRNNISANELLELALDANRTGANSYSEIILGLPGETKSSHEQTVRIILDAGFTNIYLFQLMLLPGSEMSTGISRHSYQMNTMYRVLPRCYGRYSVLDDVLVSAEIEEICVSTNTLSFDDYLECRSMHLFVTIFYNDGLFSSLLKLIRSKGWSPWRWIELMMSRELPHQFNSLYKNFRYATEHELWPTREALLEFIHGSNVVDKFLNGELGNNLLFIHKSLAIRDCAPELAKLAQEATKDLARENNDASEELHQFINDCASYHQFKMTNLFSHLDETIEMEFEYDIASFEQCAVVNDLNYYRFPHLQLVSFTLSPQQILVIRDYLSLYGSDTVGIGRILSKVYAGKLFRNPDTLENKISNRHKLTTAADFSVSGLQN